MHNEALRMAKWAMADACAKGYDNMTSQDWDDFKDCLETAKNAIKCDYYYRLVECMKKDEEEEKREDAYFLDMLKEEYKDDYNRMREQYGEEEGERRFYDNYRHANGRFARKGTGMYEPRRSGRRRGYDEPPYWHVMPDGYRMTPEDYRSHTPEELRDLDREKYGRLYYTNPAAMNMNVGYPNRHDERSQDGEGRDSREGKSGLLRRTYIETKEINKGNTPQEKQEKMKSLEGYMKELSEDVTQMIEDASPEEKALLKQKLQVLAQKVN